MKMTTKEINDIIKDFLEEYDNDLHPLTDLVEENNVAYLSIHRWKEDVDTQKGVVLSERIKNLVQVYGECELLKDADGSTSATVFDVYKLIPNGY